MLYGEYSTKCYMQKKKTNKIKLAKESNEVIMYSYNTEDEEVQVLIDLQTKKDAYLYKYIQKGVVKFQHDYLKNIIHLTYSKEKKMLEIKNVKTGVGKGICTKSVAYTMKALIAFQNNLGNYIVWGKVSIISKNACAAFNCYNRAFEANNFILSDNSEFDDFQKKYNVLGTAYTFQSYYNKEQHLKQIAKTKRVQKRLLL